MGQFRNRYLFCDHDGTQIEFDRIIEDDQNVRARYFVRALLSIEANSDLSGMVFIVMSQGTETIPVHGDNVVAVITSDEQFRVPAFADKVGMIFRTHGSMPFFEGIPTDQVQFLSLLRYLRSCVAHVKSRVAHMRRGGGAIPPTRFIPIGDRDLVNLPTAPIDERPHDVSFIGSVQTRRLPGLTVQSMLGTPKAVSRVRMLEALQHYKRTRPDRAVLLQTTSDFTASQNAGALPFSQVLAATKICVTPRGNCPETYRLLQGARFGCVLIAERLPPHWFFRNHPAYIIRHWSEALPIMDRLLDDPALLAAKSAESLAWWNDVVSEHVTGQYIAREVAQTLVGPARASAGHAKVAALAGA